MEIHQQQFDFDESAADQIRQLGDTPFVSRKPWNAQLTLRQRVLLHMEPILRLYRQPGTRDEWHLKYDTLAIIMKVFDTIIDQSGFGSEVTDEIVIDAVSPLLRAWDDARGDPPSPERYADVVHRVLAELKNEDERQEPFEIPYHAFDESGSPRQYVLRFKLLIEQFGYDGSIVLKLSSEAINLFLNAFGLDIEDAQVANEAVVKSQLERGRFNEAVQSAQNARGQSMRFDAKINWLLRQISRDIDRVDWRGEADALLKEALEHVQNRMSMEDNILLSAQEKMDGLDEDDSRRSALAEVIRLMKECHRRHLLLHERLMPARGEYLKQQAKQAFVTYDLRESIDLRDCVLRELLQLPREIATGILASGVDAFLGPQAPTLLNLKELVYWQLQPKRQVSKGLDTTEEIILDRFEESEKRFDDEMMDEATQALATLSGKTLLSSIISDFESRGRNNGAVDLLVLQVIRAFGDENEETGYQVDLADKDGLRCNRHKGDDLWVIPDENGGEVGHVDSA